MTIVLFVLSGCSTAKNTTISRSYHNLISHYNIYFNGIESYRKGIKNAEKSYIDNYSQILPLFYYTDKTTSQSISPDMDRASKKASKVITLHSITAKPELKKGAQSNRQKEFYNLKQYNKWMDENYLLLGKTYVYKNDFLLATETFKYVISEFPNTNSKYDAMIWLARCYNETGEFRESERILNILQSEGKMPSKLFFDFYTTYTDFYLKQKNYENAATMLEKALSYKSSKFYRIRYTYILAQIYQKNEDYNKSAEYYKKVIKMNPPYEMTFNAKINLAGTFDASSGEAKEIRSLLKKMLKDEKNKEFLDQIYYALANMALKENNIEEAMKLFKLSASKSTTNANQKALTYLTLGDLYYNRQDYPNSQAYYDSTLQNINKEDEKYPALSLKAEYLTNLVNNLNVYQLEDSVQILAKMTDGERIAAIDKLIAAVLIREQEEAKKSQQNVMGTQYGVLNQESKNLVLGGDNVGSWYFYSPSAKSFGQPEFRMKWGNRKLEDNWRRSNKQTIENFENAESNEISDSTGIVGTTVVINNKTREYYLKNIPLTDEAMVISNERLATALYNMGIIYLENLNDTDKSIKSFEELVKRYPDNEKVLPSYYNLYKIYLKKGDVSRTQEYKNLIISKFPDSPTAMMLTNPDYVSQLEEKESEANKYYELTYEKYKMGDYSGVLNSSDYALKEFHGHELQPRFELLKALSIGQMQGREKMKEVLDTLARAFPKHEAGIYARELIDHIYTETPEIKIADLRKAAEVIFTFDSLEVHYFVLAAPTSLDINQLNFNLINFNLDNFNNLNLGIAIEGIGDTSILVVSSFANIEKTLPYKEILINNKELFNGFDAKDILLFIISESNLKKLREDGDVNKYYIYYKNYYE